MPAYLDHNATTPVDPRVVEAMLPYLKGPYGNPSSLHRHGRAARDGIERARAQVAALVGAQPQEVIWTSGGTEANNLALKGLCTGRPRGRLLYGATEHPAVMEAAESLTAEGWAVEQIGVTPQGLVDWPAFAAQCAAGPLRLASLMRANNETGLIQDTVKAGPAKPIDDPRSIHAATSPCTGSTCVRWNSWAVKRSPVRVSRVSSPAMPVR